VPPLAYTSNNAPFHQYNEDLSRLLTKLDAVESGGDKSIREKRRDLARRVEREAERVEQWKDTVWESREMAHSQADSGEGGALPTTDTSMSVDLPLEAAPTEEPVESPETPHPHAASDIGPSEEGAASTTDTSMSVDLPLDVAPVAEELVESKRTNPDDAQRDTAVSAAESEQSPATAESILPDESLSPDSETIRPHPQPSPVRCDLMDPSYVANAAEPERSPAAQDESLATGPQIIDAHYQPSLIPSADIPTSPSPSLPTAELTPTSEDSSAPSERPSESQSDSEGSVSQILTPVDMNVDLPKDVETADSPQSPVVEDLDVSDAAGVSPSKASLVDQDWKSMDESVMC